VDCAVIGETEREREREREREEIKKEKFFPHKYGHS
jgi:hypothetical protein